MDTLIFLSSTFSIDGDPEIRVEYISRSYLSASL